MMATAVILRLLLAHIVLLFPRGQDLWMVSKAQSLSTVKDVFVKAGNDAEFPWKANTSGLTITTIVWRKDTTTVAQLIGQTFLAGTGYGGRVSQIGDANAGIILTNVQSSDFEKYQCTVTLSDGTTLVKTANLTEAVLPQNVTVSWNATELRQGESLVLTCDSKGGIPPPSYIWLGNGPVNSTSSNTLVVHFSQLPSEIEVFICIAINVAGNATSSNAARVTKEMTKEENGTYTVDSVPAVLGSLAGAGGIIVLSGTAYYLWKRMKVIDVGLELSLSGRTLEARWTYKSEGSCKVLYSHEGSKEWILGPEVTRDESSNYTYTVELLQDGTFEVCVLVTNTKGEKRSHTKKITVNE